MTFSVFITIDTEEDTWNAYSTTENPVRNIERVPALQALFDRYGAVPTYLVNYPVATDPRAQAIFRTILDRGGCEVGTHIHPWNTPPFREPLSEVNSMLCNLPPALQREKLQAVHSAIREGLGVTPQTFRAGRWGFGSAAAAVILELGYRVDTSVSPLTDWSRHHGPDFMDAPQDRYPFHPRSVLTPDPDGPLLEVPPTIGFLQPFPGLCRAVRQRAAQSRTLSALHLLGGLERLRLLNRRWLSPEHGSAGDLILLARRTLARGADDLNFTFHSTTLLPGKSPFVRDEADGERFLGTIETFLAFVRRAGGSFRPLSDAARPAVNLSSSKGGTPSWQTYP